LAGLQAIMVCKANNDTLQYQENSTTCFGRSGFGAATFKHFHFEAGDFACSNFETGDFVQ
jgi:hypothetical protein